MKVSGVISVFEALNILSDSEELEGYVSFRIAHNKSLLKNIVENFEDKRSTWLKDNCEANEKGEYNIQGEMLKRYSDYIKPILDEEVQIPDGMKFLVGDSEDDKKSDIPKGIKPDALIPLIGVCIK